MTEPTARAVGTIGIWLATAIILTFGVFHMTWNGDIATLLMLILVLAICAAATIATATVWGWRPAKKDAVMSQPGRQTSVE
jgi:hypothetical protein